MNRKQLLTEIRFAIAESKAARPRSSLNRLWNWALKVWAGP